MSSNKLKLLESRKKDIEYELDLLFNEKNTIHSKEQKLSSEREHILAQINDMKVKSSDPIVSEHAMLRYIERVIGIDLQEIRDRILTPDTVKLINTFGSGTFPADGFKVAAKSRVVTTILLNDMKGK